MTGQGTNAILDVLGNLGQGLAGLDALLRPLANLSVNLGGVAVIGQELLVRGKAVEMALLLVGDAAQVVVDVFDLLALGVLLVGEKLGDEDTRGFALAGRGLLLLSGLSLLLLLGGAGSRGGTLLAFLIAGLGIAVVAVGGGGDGLGLFDCLSKSISQ